MNISKETIDELNAVIKVQIEKNDYLEKVNNVLKDYRKKANMPGFRPGKVPFGIVNKMYRLPVMQEEINKILSETVSKFIIDENLKILGEPLPSVDQPSKINWENQENFEFEFDIALQPEFELKIPKKDKLKYYNIKIEDELIENSVKNYTRRFGSLIPTENITGKEMIKADLIQLDKEGNELQNGMKTENSVLSLDRIKEENIKNLFISKKINDSIIINLKKAFPNETEIAGILKITKEKASQIDTDFKLTLKEVNHFQEAELNQDLFDKIFGKDIIKTKEEFRNKIIDDLVKNFKQQSDYKLLLDIKDLIINKNKIDLPADFLKRWIKAVNKEKLTDEQVEKEFPLFEKDLKWQLIKNNIIKENEIKVSEEELFEIAREHVINQFNQYGILNVENEYIENYTKDILKKDDEKNRLNEKKYEEKVVNFIKESIKIDDKEITKEEFYKLFENK